ncbi:hypothetical protein QR680_013014 [Steinernema hermaphroditum]|uniref:Uncharacterized protein n=1 Tax=Steinernema hermaphroditum TaxID=289476 RepID=A0AA39I439_9BILA|nr:hypothetical protein QR680_013014 [Steinernema hermaphroditum]
MSEQRPDLRLMAKHAHQRQASDCIFIDGFSSTLKTRHALRRPLLIDRIPDFGACIARSLLERRGKKRTTSTFEQFSAFR